MKRPPIERVSWIDALHPSGEWTPIKAHKSPLPVIESAGFLIYEDKRKIVLASAVDGAGHETGGVTIPKSAVVKRRVLR